jgi:hypothetical protein
MLALSTTADAARRHVGKAQVATLPIHVAPEPSYWMYRRCSSAARAADPYTVCFPSHTVRPYLGRDPDVNVRFELRRNYPRDSPSSTGNWWTSSKIVAAARHLRSFDFFIVSLFVSPVVDSETLVVLVVAVDATRCRDVTCIEPSPPVPGEGVAAGYAPIRQSSDQWFGRIIQPYGRIDFE